MHVNCDKNNTTDRRRISVKFNELFTYLQIQQRIKNWNSRGKFILSNEVQLLLEGALLRDFAADKATDNRSKFASIVNDLLNRNTSILRAFIAR